MSIPFSNNPASMAALPALYMIRLSRRRSAARLTAEPMAMPRSPVLKEQVPPASSMALQSAKPQ